VRRPGRAAALAALAALAACVVALGVGPVSLDPLEVARALLGLGGDDLARDVVRLDRAPRIALGAAVGAALAVSGVLFQALLRNPLADPYLVGVGPGALLGAAVAGALGLAGGSVAGFSVAGAAAFAGSALAAVLVLGVAGRGGRGAPARLLLAGVAVGSFVTAVATWALYTQNESWQHAIRWLLGSLAYADGRRVGVAWVAAVAIVSLAWARGRDLDALATGEEAARLGGLDVPRAVAWLAAAGCALTAAAVATAGLVGFVGLVVPHLARRLAGPGHRALVPVAALLGAGLLVAVDAVARVASRTEVPVGVVTALLGAPVFAAIVRRAGRGRG
jgi:iron complex transport system permease protein